MSLSSPLQAKDQNTETVLDVLDGHTLLLSSGRRARLIGVDSATAARPADAGGESDPRGFMTYLIKGQRVRLELEPGFARLNHRDSNGDIFVYVWFTSPLFHQPPDWLVVNPNVPGGRYDAFLNASMLRAGCAVMDRRYPFKFADKFLALEEEAKRAGRGIWNSGAADSSQEKPAA